MAAPAVPTAEEIFGRIADVLGVPGSRVGADVVLAELVSDSYRLVEMAISEDDYDVIFTQADLSGVTTVGDLAHLVLSRA